MPDVWAGLVEVWVGGADVGGRVSEFCGLVPGFCGVSAEVLPDGRVTTLPFAGRYSAPF